MLELHGLIRAKNPRVVLTHLKRIVAGQPDPRHLWNEDQAFRALMNVVRRRTLLSREKCWMLYQYARHVRTLPGEVAEVGAYKGGSARLLAEVCQPQEKPVHIFDTFEGMPKGDSTEDLYGEGDLTDTSLEQVQVFLRGLGHVRFYKGVFPATSDPVRDRTFCLVHIDVDIYRSVKDCCEFFYPRVVKGGIIVFDDYGSVTCKSGKKAFDEFFASKPEAPYYLPTGQCVVHRL